MFFDPPFDPNRGNAYAGEPASYGEYAEAILERQRRVDNYNAIDLYVERGYAEDIDKIKSAAGLELENPHILYGRRQQARSIMRGRSGDPFGIEDGWRDNYSDPYERYAQEIDRNADKLRSAGLDPDALKYRPLMEAQRRAKQATSSLDRISETIGPWWRPDLLGVQIGAGFYGMLDSPVDTAINLGSGVAGSVRQSLIRNMMKNAAANAAAQAALEPGIQSNRQWLGVESSWQESVANIGMAFLLGGSLDLIGRAPLRAARALRGEQSLGGIFRDAIPVIPQASGPAPIIDPDVLAKAYAGDPEAFGRLAEITGTADDDLVKGAKLYMETGGVQDAAIMQAFDKLGIDVGERERFLAGLLRRDNGEPPPRVPDPIPEARSPSLAEDQPGLAQRAGSNQFEGKTEIDGRPAATRTLSKEVVAQAARIDALEDRIADRVIAFERQDGTLVLNGKPNPDGTPAIVLREANGWTEADARKIGMRQVLQDGYDNPVEIARQIRATPDLIDSSVPITEPVSAARAIAKLSDRAFAMVERGDANLETARLVGETQIDPQHHADLLERLMREAPDDMDAARQVLADHAPQDTVAAISTIAGVDPSDIDMSPVKNIDNPKVQTERLTEQLAEDIAAAEQPIVLKRELESKVETIRGEIAKFGDSDAEKLAKLSTDLREAMRQLDRVNRDLDHLRNGTRPGIMEDMVDYVLERAAVRRQLEARRAIADAVKFARTMLGDGQRIYQVPELRSPAGVELDAAANTRTGDIVLALKALDPTAKLSHEGVHVLITRGVLSPAEMRLLAAAGRKAAVMKPETEVNYRAYFQSEEFMQRYPGKIDIEALIDEEMAAHFIDASVAGKLTPEPEPATIVGRVKRFFDRMGERLQNAREGAGFQTVDELRDAILNGEVARRQAIRDWMRVNDVSAMTMRGPGGVRTLVPEAEARGFVSEDVAAAALPGDQFMPAISDRETGRSMRADMDALGYRSAALDAARNLKQAKGTPEQMLAQLKSAGVKDAEIEATGLGEFLRNKAAGPEPGGGKPEAGATGASLVLAETDLTVFPDAWLGKHPYERADEAASALRSAIPGATFEVVRSGSAAGDSAYIKTPLGDIRISDHGANPKADTVWTDTGNNAASMSPRKFVEFVAERMGRQVDTLLAGKPPNQYGTPRPNWMEADQWRDIYNANRKAQPTITRDDIISHLEQNRVGLEEVKYDRSPPTETELARLRRNNGSEEDRLMAELGITEDPEFLRSFDRTKWSNYSLDPSNPTYRETVLHLPPNLQRAKAAWDAQYDHDGLKPESRKSWDSISAEDKEYWARKNTEEFRSGHFDQPNIVGHMMTSMVKHEGKPAYLIDQIQSDWGQKLRDGGVRDEAKIAELEKRLRDFQSAADSYIMKDPAELVRRAYPDADIDGGVPRVTYWLERLARDDKADVELREIASDYRLTIQRLVAPIQLAEAELRTVKAATPGNPLVNTTDQWVNTTLRRAIRQAAEADAAYIAIPSGDTVLSYNPQGDAEGNAYFYGKIVPKNLRNLLRKLDKSSPDPTFVKKIETSQGLQGWKGDDGRSRPGNGADPEKTGFTVFPLTDAVKRSVVQDGQMMFAFAGERAKTADLDALSKAKAMESDGVDRDVIWRETGWGRGTDRRWRFEIDDSGATLRSPDEMRHLVHEMKSKRKSLLDEAKARLDDSKTQPDLFPKDAQRARGALKSEALGVKAKINENFGPLWSEFAGRRAEHAFRHNDAFSAYPDIGRDVIVRRGGSGVFSDIRGRYSHDRKSIDINSGLSSTEARSTGLHELQHAVQAREGFARGGSPDDFVYQNSPLFRHRGPAEEPFDAYRRLAGEVEARTVQKRMNMTAEERRARPFWYDYDVQESEQIVRFANGESVSELSYSEEPPVPGIAMHGDMMFAIKAYHGSPHDFDRFDMSRVGTGEGAQAYGYGLYFAENEGVARSYRDALKGRQRYMKPPRDEIEGAVQDEIWAHIKALGPSGSDDVINLRHVIRNAVEGERLPQSASEAFEDMVRDGRIANTVNQGRIYEVRINAEHEEFLDWDRPLSEQSEKVKTRLGVPPPEKLAEAERLVTEIDRLNRIIDGGGTSRDPHPDTAMRMKDDLVEKYLEIDPGQSAWWKFDIKDQDAGPEMAQKLRDAGIKGIRYLDQGSRGAGEGTHNFVVFDDSIVEIVAKDGQPVTPAERAELTQAMTPADGAMFAIRQDNDGIPQTPGLDMSREARMARAEQMGFDTGRVLYHGTAKSFEAFDQKQFGSSTKASGANQAAWFVDDPRTAAGYADYAAGADVRELLSKADTYERLAQKDKSGGARWWDKQDDAVRRAEEMEAEGYSGQSVVPVFLRGRFLERDFGGAEYTDVARDVTRLLRDAKAGGYDGVRLTNLADDVALSSRPATHYAVFDPRNIRSVNAAFDPVLSDSPNLMYAIRQDQPKDPVARLSSRVRRLASQVAIDDATQARIDAGINVLNTLQDAGAERGLDPQTTAPLIARAGMDQTQPMLDMIEATLGPDRFAAIRADVVRAFDGVPMEPRAMAEAINGLLDQYLPEAPRAPQAANDNPPMQTGVDFESPFQRDLALLDQLDETTQLLQACRL